MRIGHTHSGRFCEKVSICAANTHNFSNRGAKIRATIILICLSSALCCQGEAIIVGSDRSGDFDSVEAVRDALKAGEGESALYASGDAASDEAVMAEGFYYELHDDEVDGEFWFESSDQIGDGIYLATSRGYLENKADYKLYDVGLALQFYAIPDKHKVFSYDNSDHTWHYYDDWWAKAYGVEGQNILLSLDRSITDVALSTHYEGMHLSVLETDEVTLIPFGDLLPGEWAYRNLYFHKNGFSGYTWVGHVVSKTAHGPVSLRGLEIVGPNRAEGSFWTGYKAMADYGNNIKRDVTDLAQWWVEPPSAATIPGGLLMAKAMDEVGEITVHAAYSEGASRRKAQRSVELYPDERVGLRVPSDFGTIQAAINAAEDGDLVVIEPGRYRGEGNCDIDFMGKAITVRSTDPYDAGIIASTIIDCNGTAEDWHCGFYFHRKEDGHSVLAGLTITNGYVLRNGGGINCYNSSPTIVNCTIAGNQATAGGGGVFNDSGSPTVVNCIFSANTAYGGGRFSGGGGMSSYDSSRPRLYNCMFIGNSSHGRGGGMISYGSSATLIDCIFSGNQAGTGGGLQNSAGTIQMRDCVFIGNSAGICGGAMNNLDSGGDIWNCVFSRNTATDHGAAIAGEGSDLNLVNCTFSQNRAPEGRALGCESDVQVTNCVLWDGGSEVWRGDNSKITVKYSDVQGGFEGEGNIDADPCFAFVADYHLMAGSPCIDAGTNVPNIGLAVTDMDGNRRRLDGDGDGNSVADMGAYEYNPCGQSIAVSERVFSFVKGRRESTQRLQIRSCGCGALNWEIMEDCEWLEVGPRSGVSRGDVYEVSLIADFNGFAPGYRDECTLTVVGEDAVNSPVTIDVSLYVPRTLHVPGEYETIQEAIDGASDFDTVVVSPGRYTGDGNRDLDFEGKPITVCSINPQDPRIVASTIIDCNGAYEDYHRGFYFHYSEDANSIVDGLTIINGYVPINSYGPYGDHWILVPWPWLWPEPNDWSDWADDWLQEFKDYEVAGVTEKFFVNYATAESTTSDGSESRGGAISCEQARPTIRNCIIRNNSSGIYGCNGPVTNCVISGNSGTGLANCKGPVTNCVISDNLYEGLAECSGVISNSAVINNYGRGLANSEGSATVTNCIFWRNRPVFGSESHLKYGPQIQLGEPGGGIYFPSPASADLLIRYSDIEGGQEGIYVGPGCTLDYGKGNTDQDPLVTADGHLQVGSPCINAGDPNSDAVIQTDIDGETRVADGRVDMGADEYIDGDKDGLANWWEKKYFDDANGAEPEEDPDFDEYANLAEYVLSSNPVVAGKTYYVDSNRPDDSGDGLSRQTAKKTIQAAIWETWYTDSIIVAEGRYTGGGNRDLVFGSRSIRLSSEDPTDDNVIAATVIDCNGTPEDHHRAIRFYDNGPYSVIKGLTITDGYAERGGAISCYGGSPTIRSCNITGNTAEYAGGAIDCNESSPTIIDCDISGNRSLDVGGAISCLTSGATIRRCSIVNNEGERGGAIYCEEGNPVIIDCDISGNHSDRGGGIYCANNRATIICSTINRNRAGYGGGVFCYYGSPVINNCEITGNYAESNGGGICGNSASDCHPEFTNCIISGNSASEGGGLCHSYGVLRNCTIVGNRAYAILRCRLYVDNCIIWDNRPALGLCLPWNCIEGVAEPIECISSDPCFISGGYWDANGTVSDVDDDFWVEGDYHLKSQVGRWELESETWGSDDLTSPCIDAGSPDSDWTAELWPHGKRINMGAYGGTPEASMSLSSAGNVADLDNDGVVGFADMEMLVEKWLFDETLLAEDVDRNKSVDFKDFAVLADNWLWQEQ